MSQSTTSRALDSRRDFVPAGDRGRDLVHRDRWHREVVPVAVVAAGRPSRERQPVTGDRGMRRVLAWREGIRSFRERSGHVAA